MDIYAMHVLFRTLGQQQGLQQVRGILAESIDEFLNEAIIQNVRVALLNNSQPSKDSHTPQYTKISSINAYHTLFVTEIITKNLSHEETNVGKTTEVTLDNAPLCITNFSINYNAGDNKAINKNCRVIESERLNQTLDDYLNRASYDYPIVSLVNGNSDTQFDIILFTGDSQKDVKDIVVNYIKMPNVVHLDEENYGTPQDTSISCNLPEHLHHQIVETAVGFWFRSLGLTSEQPSQRNNNNND